MFVEATKNDPTESVLQFRHRKCGKYQFETVFSCGYVSVNLLIGELRPLEYDTSKCNAALILLHCPNKELNTYSFCVYIP